MDVLKALGETILKMFAADLWLSLTALAVIGLTTLGLAHGLPAGVAPFALTAGIAAALAIGVARGARR